MPIVIGAVAPHGFPIIPVISEDADGALKTRAAMEEMRRRFAEARPDVVVITGPHGVSVEGAIVVSASARGAGTLHWQGQAVEMNVPFDLPLSQAIAERAQAAGLPIAQVGYGSSDPRASVYPLDWGIMTPLWFAGQNRNMTGMGTVLAAYLHGMPQDQPPAAVVVNPARRLPREMNVTFGRAVAEAAQADDRRIAFIASCDWAHAHSESGPYGHHPAAKEMDDLVVAAIRDNDPKRLMSLDDDFIRNAAIDGLWQLLMLAGVMDVVPMDVDFLSYEAPTYYGMVVATYTPVG